MGNAVGYRYPHDDPRGVLRQDYLPEDLVDAITGPPTTAGRTLWASGWRPFAASSGEAGRLCPVNPSSTRQMYRQSYRHEQ